MGVCAQDWPPSLPPPSTCLLGSLVSTETTNSRLGVGEGEELGPRRDGGRKKAPFGRPLGEREGGAVLLGAGMVLRRSERASEQARTSEGWPLPWQANLCLHAGTEALPPPSPKLEEVMISGGGGGGYYSRVRGTHFAHAQRRSRLRYGFVCRLPRLS